MNVLDKIISVVSPSTALKRQQARNVIAMRRSYEGATKGRRGNTFNTPGNQNPNIDIQRSVVSLRERSIDGYKNNSNVKKAVSVIQNNTVGTGIMATPVPVAGDKELTKTETKNIKSYWEHFVKKADFDGTFNFYGLQSLAMRTIAMQGEIFLVRQRETVRRGVKQKVPFKLQIMSPHMVDVNKSSLVGTSREGNYVVQGVEFDSRGRKVGYWMYAYDPKNEYTVKLSPDFISIDDVVQVFYKEYPDQVRGVPFGVSTILNARDLADYEDAQLMLQKIAACHVAFTTRPVPEDVSTNVDEETDGITEHLEPGLIQELAPGEEVTFNNPPTPSGYGEYTTKTLHKIAAGYGITYEQLTGDMSNVNFSSGRMGWIEAQRQIEDWQYNFFIPQFCDSVWDWFIQSLLDMGVISRYVGVEWTPQGREMLDPVKEMNGLILELKSGLVSWTEACKRRGYNPDAMIEQIKRDRALFEEAGINVEWILQEEVSDEEVKESAENEGDGVDSVNSEDLKRSMDTYGVGVRAGTITPIQADEEYFRKQGGLPDINEAVEESWKSSGGFRTPITLKVEEKGLIDGEEVPENTETENN